MQKYFQGLIPFYKEEYREAMSALYKWLEERRATCEELYQDTNDNEYYDLHLHYHTIIGDIANGFMEYCKEQEGLNE